MEKEPESTTVVTEDEDMKSYTEELIRTRSSLLESISLLDVPKDDEEIATMIAQFVATLKDEDANLSFELLRFMAHFVLQVLGNVKMCRDILEAAVRLYDDLDCLIALANFECDVCNQLDEAEDLYRECLELQADHPDACNNLGALLIDRAKQTDNDEQKSKYFDEAQEVLSRALNASPPVVIYNIACACSLNGSSEKCKIWLEKGLKAGVLPAPDVLCTDPDLSTARSSTWFESFIKLYREAALAENDK